MAGYMGKVIRGQTGAISAVFALKALAVMLAERLQSQMMYFHLRPDMNNICTVEDSKNLRFLNVINNITTPFPQK